jgi:hypothetical protein
MPIMTMQDRGMTRAQLKTGSGKGLDVADEHVHEVLGSRDFWVYVTPKSKPKGYEDLKAYLLEQGCMVDVSDTAPMLPAKGYKAIKITRVGENLTDDVVRRTHRWAHQRNYLHSFFKPYKSV